jgi:hypothetical protein
MGDRWERGGGEALETVAPAESFRFAAARPEPLSDGRRGVKRWGVHMLSSGRRVGGSLGIGWEGDSVHPRAGPLSITVVQ